MQLKNDRTHQSHEAMTAHTPLYAKPQLSDAQVIDKLVECILRSAKEPLFQFYFKQLIQKTNRSQLAQIILERSEQSKPEKNPENYHYRLEQIRVLSIEKISNHTAASSTTAQCN